MRTYLVLHQTCRGLVTAACSLPLERHDAAEAAASAATIAGARSNAHPASSSIDPAASLPPLATLPIILATNTRMESWAEADMLLLRNSASTCTWSAGEGQGILGSAAAAVAAAAQGVGNVLKAAVSAVVGRSGSARWRGEGQEVLNPYGSLATEQSGTMGGCSCRAIPQHINCKTADC